jgi:hypothetical protein
VKVVSHQTISVDLELGFKTGFTEGFEEKFAVRIVEEDVFTPVAAVHDVVKGPRELNSQLARHGEDDAGRNSNRAIKYYNTIDRPLFFSFGVKAKEGSIVAHKIFLYWPVGIVSERWRKRN